MHRKDIRGRAACPAGYGGKTPALIFTADLVKATVRILSGERNSRPEWIDSAVISASGHITEAPAVSFHFNLIEQAIRYLLPQDRGSAPSYSPVALIRAARIFLSHDVDVSANGRRNASCTNSCFPSAICSVWTGRGSNSTLASLRDAFRGRDPYWNFDNSSSWETGTDSNHMVSRPVRGIYQKRENEYDPVYRRKPSQITSMIRRIIENDCEVAFHGTRNSSGISRSSAASSPPSRTVSDPAHGGAPPLPDGPSRPVVRGRLRSGDALRRHARVQRQNRLPNGIAAPFFPYTVNNPAGKIVEVPLHFMDSVFTHTKDPHDTVARRITETYLFAKAAGGLFGVLIHPGNMDPSEMPQLSRFYHSFLNRCRLDRAKSMTGVELAQWWSARENVIKSRSEERPRRMEDSGRGGSRGDGVLHYRAGHPHDEVRGRRGAGRLGGS